MKVHRLARREKIERASKPFQDERIVDGRHPINTRHPEKQNGAKGATMSTATITKAEPAESTVSLPLAAALGNHIAPPFDGWGYYKTPRYQPSGFWSAVRHRAGNGELVVQLGRSGGAGPAIQWAGYSYAVPRNAGLVTYTADFCPVSLTRSPNHGVNLCAFAQVNYNQPIVREFSGNQPFSVAVTGYGPFTLRVGCFVFLKNYGTYGEVIARVCNVTEKRYYYAAGDDGKASVSAEPIAAGEGGAFFDQLLAAAAKNVSEREVGALEEASAAGLVSFDD